MTIQTPTERRTLSEIGESGVLTNRATIEEATKMVQLRHTFGPDVSFNLFLCGYFNAGYLGFEASEGIDWVWEHRIDDLTAFGL